MTRWRQLFGRARADRELAREIQAHIAERVDDLTDRGLSSADARRQALGEFGNPTRCVEESRAVWLIPWLVSLGQDIRYILRMLRRQPVFSVSVVFILTFGIGLVTALFTVFSATVLRPWPVSDAASLVLVRPRPSKGEQYGTLSNLEYRYFREHARSFSQLASAIPGGSPVGRLDGSVFATVQSKYVTANYFDALRVGMAIGRGFLPEDEDYRAPKAVIIISERFWREYFGSDPALIGQPIRVGDQLRTVVGVAERGFADVRGSIRVDLWLPLPTLAIAFTAGPSADALRSFDDPRQSGPQVFGRLRPGVTVEEARAELDVLSRQLRTAFAMEAPGLRLTDTRPFSEDPKGISRQLPAMSFMLAAVVLVMLLACANVGNLVLAKTVARRGEIAIRLSLGASRARVARQLLTETLVLSLISGALALYLAATVPSLLIGLGGSEIRNRDHLTPDALVFAFTLVMSMLACACASLGPAMSATRSATIGVGQQAHGASSHRLRVTLLAVQIALSTVLLVGAGLLTRGISHAMSLDPGFPISEIQEVSLRLPRNAPAGAIGGIHAALIAADLPTLAFSSLPPITSSRMEIGVRHPSQGAERNRRLVLRPVSASYFAVLGIPLVTGRTFGDHASGRELIVSQSAARLLWPNDDPLGKRLVSGATDTPPIAREIVAVVSDVPTTTLAEIEPVVYEPAEAGGSVVLIRDLAPAVAARVDTIVQAAMPGASAVARPLVEEMRDSLTNLIMGSRVAWVLGLLALLLATIGAFGVFSSTVEERRREIGVRMALGARGWQVIRLVLIGASRPVLAGLLAGVALSLIVTPLLRNAMYGMSPFDPIAYLEIAIILLTASLLATWIPAARAARVEPTITLRGD